MSLLLANMAAMRVRKLNADSPSYGLYAAISVEAAKVGVEDEIVQIQFDKLFPGILWPTATSKKTTLQMKEPKVKPKSEHPSLALRKKPRRVFDE